MPGSRSTGSLLQAVEGLGIMVQYPILRLLADVLLRSEDGKGVDLA